MQRAEEIGAGGRGGNVRGAGEERGDIWLRTLRDAGVLRNG